MKKREVHASVKDERLVKIRRNQMIKSAIALFKQKGFHRTTTREIAREAGFSIGTLYEYIRSKEDILYLVCDNIYDEVQDQLAQDLVSHQGTLASLRHGIENFFRIMDGVQEEVLVMYQEAKSLTKDALPYVLKKEIAMVSMLEDVIQLVVDKGELNMTPKEVNLLAHNIVVQGQMWGFRRWTIQKQYSLDDYIKMQTDWIFQGLKGYMVKEPEGRI
ncbi:TetR/AcrR family transcriptional regulator [Neobacillus sp. LXY-4]|uniref:TetR/AcrR family transcriptional regulator n=1 Tax=Neobacillus sp. LXY-4 TaxID=3379826 RepID=UPI003EDFDF70